MGQLVKTPILPSSIGQYALNVKNGILKKANSFGGTSNVGEYALNFKNGILKKANSFSKSISFNKKNEEKLEMIFREVAPYQVHKNI